MASINFNPFEKWFSKPPNPVPAISLHSFSQALFPKAMNATNFASISSTLFRKDPKKPEKEPDEPGPYTRMLDQFFWECENLPDHRHTPEVEAIMNEDPIFEKKENPTEEEIRENEQWWKDFRFVCYVKLNSLLNCPN